MTRMSKQGERRAVSRKRPSPPSVKTGPKEDRLPKGFKEHHNAAAGTALEHSIFIPKSR